MSFGFFAAGGGFTFNLSEEEMSKEKPSWIAFHGGDKDEPFIVETVAPAGHLLESHKHKHSHVSVLVSGIADVTVDGVTERKTGYCVVTIPANTIHSVQAVTDIVWLCIWSGDVAPVDQALESLKLVAP